MPSNFRFPTLFVVPTSNTLPTGSTATATLTAGQFGIYRPDGTPATSANSAAAPYLQLFQGNSAAQAGAPTKRTDKIFKSNILEWYKVPALQTASNQISTVSGLVVHAGEDVIVSLRLLSDLIENAYYNGLTRSVRANSPCPDCGDDPCAELATADYDALYTALANGINNDQLLKQYVTAAKSGSGSSSVLTITGKALTSPFPVSPDVHNNVFRHDKLTFYTYVSRSPDTSVDYITEDRCDFVGTVATTQRSTYAHGSAAEVKKMEVDTFSYSNAQGRFKTLFSDPDYNTMFQSQVDAAWYDLYYVKYKQADSTTPNSTNVHLVEAAYIAVPTGAGTTIETILVNNFGAITDSSSTADISFTPLVP